MKKSRTQLVLLLVTVSSLFLLGVMQIAWIFKTARMQEAQFNHTVDMAMNRIIESLSMQQQLCSEVSKCLMACDSGSCCMAMKNMEEWAGIKDVIENDLKYYGIDLDFEFDIVDLNKATSIKPTKATYMSETLEKILEQSGYRLLIRFPEKRDFLLAQIGYIFVLSIFLLLIIFLSIIMIYRLYKREKKFSEGVVDFINTMAHELKTPLTNISLAVNMISKNNKITGDEKLFSYLNILSTERSNLKEKIDRLLSSSFTENGNANYSSVFNAAGLTGETVKNFIFRAHEKGGDIIVTSEGSDFTIKGDPGQFQIMLGNILDNSLKYCTGKPEINILLKSEDGKLILEVADNGPGIPQEYHTKVFEKYFRLPAGEIQKAEGFGLGLYQSRQIARQMKGNITLSAGRVTGLKITITLPIHKNDENRGDKK
ncbi:MAG TPA: HAMP domain-containing sensor histidine kinase [Bacteroidales bacterium]|nr:HAMP domain-containing sensor histidine kinase [Bacteroidales bacterium]